MEKTSVETLLEKSFHGDKDSAVEFFNTFLSAKLLVPSRNQKMPLSNAPEYPNDLTSVLGVKGLDSTFVPVFSEPKYIFEWCGQELDYREVKGQQLLESIPDSWWIAFNPGRDYEKEFSPWEIEKLKQGSESISEIIADIFEEDKELGIEVTKADTEELKGIKSKLQEIASQNKNILRMGCLLEKGAEDEERVLFAIRLSEDAEDDVKQEITSLIKQALIGSFSSRIVFETEANPSLAMGHISEDHFFYTKEHLGGRLSAAFKKVKKFLS